MIWYIYISCVGSIFRFKSAQITPMFFIFAYKKYIYLLLKWILFVTLIVYNLSDYDERLDNIFF